jgi:hypothetical protein
VLKVGMTGIERQEPKLMEGQEYTELTLINNNAKLKQSILSILVYFILDFFLFEEIEFFFV